MSNPSSIGGSQLILRESGICFLEEIRFTLFEPSKWRCFSRVPPSPPVLFLRDKNRKLQLAAEESTIFKYIDVSKNRGKTSELDCL